MFKLLVAMVCVLVNTAHGIECYSCKWDDKTVKGDMNKDYLFERKCRNTKKITCAGECVTYKYKFTEHNLYYEDWKTKGKTVKKFHQKRTCEVDENERREKDCEELGPKICKRYTCKKNLCNDNNHNGGLICKIKNG